MADENSPDPVSGEKDDSSPAPEDCSVSVGDAARVAKEPGAFEPEDKFHGAWQPETLVTTLASDGLPDMSVGDPTGDAPPPLTYDTLVCIEDDREFVEVWLEDVARGHRKYWKRIDSEIKEPWLTWLLKRSQGDGLPVGHLLRSRYVNGLEMERRVFKADAVRKAYGCYEVHFNGEGDRPDKYVLVRPKRPVCEHYRVQIFAKSGSSPGEPGHLDIHRNCMARRSIGGAHLGLTDEAVYACQHRSPRDPHSEKYMRDRDLVTLRTKPHTTLVPFFGMPGEERVLEKDPYSLDNVFRRKA